LALHHPDDEKASYGRTWKHTEKSLTSLRFP
jgi:hypothetical protein